MGSRGMPRRYATYVPEYAGYHMASTIGAIILGSGIALMVYYLVASLFQQRKAMENQWGGVTLEWQAPTPPPLENFNSAPKVTHEVYDYSTLDLNTMRTPVR
jgi:cytochrome c oxidase subunit 1